MDLELVNAFLTAEPANETERMIQVNVRNLNDAALKLSDKRNETATLLKKQEEELLKLSGALENQLSMAEFLAKQKGLQPVVPQQATQQSEPEVQAELVSE